MVSQTHANSLNIVVPVLQGQLWGNKEGQASTVGYRSVKYWRSCHRDNSLVTCSYICLGYTLVPYYLGQINDSVSYNEAKLCCGSALDGLQHISTMCFQSIWFTEVKLVLNYNDGTSYNNIKLLIFDQTVAKETPIHIITHHSYWTSLARSIFIPWCLFISTLPLDLESKLSQGPSFICR